MHHLYELNEFKNFIETRSRLTVSKNIRQILGQATFEFVSANGFDLYSFLGECFAKLCQRNLAAPYGTGEGSIEKHFRGDETGTVCTRAKMESSRNYFRDIST